MEFINHLISSANNYGVNPIIFLVLYFGSGIFIIPSVHGLIKIARKQMDKKHSFPLFVCFLFGWFLPYFYVVFFGKNFSPIIKLAVIAFAVISVVHYYRKKIRKSNNETIDDIENSEEDLRD